MLDPDYLACELLPVCYPLHVRQLYQRVSEYLHLPMLVVWLIVVAILAWPFSTWIGLSYWIGFPVLFAALAIGGWMITSDPEE